MRSSSNSKLGTVSGDWVQRRCSGVIGIEHWNQGWKELVFETGPWSALTTFVTLDIWLAQVVKQKSALQFRVESRWKPRKQIPLITMRRFSLHMKGRLYLLCLRSMMLYGSETRAVKNENSRVCSKLKRAWWGGCVLLWQIALQVKSWEADKFLENKKLLYFVFVDLKRAFDSVPHRGGLEHTKNAKKK